MSDTLAQIVGQKIRNLRNASGLSLEACAELAEMSMTFLGEVERGKKIPSLKTLVKLSHALAVPLNAFIVDLERDEREGVSKSELMERLSQVLTDRYSEAETRAICAFVGGLRP